MKPVPKVLESGPHAGSMARMKLLLPPLSAFLIAACAGPPETLVVKQYMVRNQDSAESDEPMVRMEKSRRLHGAVSMAERRQRLGQYYTLLWHDPDGVGQGAVEVLFEYQQGASASRVKVMRKSFPADTAQGVAEFAVIGDDYFNNGKVLSWRASVTRGGKEIASRQSYLWR
jgi:uncharacterized protein YcfL